MIVSNLKARSGCEGKAIYLTWTLPDDAASVRVYRRANDWNYYLDDPADLIYDGVAVSKLDDIPGKPWVPLAEDTFYYYTVVVTEIVTPNDDDFEVDPTASRIFALSLEVLDGKDWIWGKTPKDMRRRDGIAKAQGGGGGDLEKWMTTMGCWLNLLRGKNRAQLLNADDSKMPYPLAKERSRALGEEPDGESYDFTVTRKFNEKAAGLRRIKGTCGSIVEVIKIYTDWDSTCIDYTAQPTTCGTPLLLSTYDGVGAFKQITGTDNALL